MNPDELDDTDRKVLSDISQYGLHIVHIIGEEELPPFSFSIGLFENYSHPEIIIIGLVQELTHSLINDIAHDIKKGKKFEALNYYPDILEGFDCYFIEVDIANYREYLGYANWYYNGDSFPAVQCIYPTTKGIYPWQEEWPDNIKGLQPILGKIIGN